VASKELTLSIERRAKTGTTDAHSLRRAGKVPAVVYGHGAEPLHVAFDVRAFDELLHHGGRTNMITLTLDGKRADTALVRELQRNPVSRKIEHVDFQRVSADEAVHAKLPVVTVGTAQGVRDFGGVMDILIHEVEIEGPAAQLPDHLDVDVSALEIHQHVTAAEIPLPKNFKLITPGDAIVVSIESSKTARQVEEAETGVTAEIVEPEVVGQQPEASGE
jgi:large subunit ribosomal protein L25